MIRFWMLALKSDRKRIGQLKLELADLVERVQRRRKQREREREQMKSQNKADITLAPDQCPRRALRDEVPQWFQPKV